MEKVSHACWDSFSKAGYIRVYAWLFFQGRKKRNPAADPRKMRRVIAEDPEWNLETVPPLVDVCVSHIVQNFGGKYSTESLR